MEMFIWMSYPLRTPRTRLSMKNEPDDIEYKNDINSVTYLLLSAVQSMPSSSDHPLHRLSEHISEYII